MHRFSVCVGLRRLKCSSGQCCPLNVANACACCLIRVPFKNLVVTSCNPVQFEYTLCGPCTTSISFPYRPNYIGTFFKIILVLRHLKKRRKCEYWWASPQRITRLSFRRRHSASPMLINLQLQQSSSPL